MRIRIKIRKGLRDHKYSEKQHRDRTKYFKKIKHKPRESL